ncbi:MAG: glycogen debranching protein GlgX [Pararhizobium sp.]
MDLTETSGLGPRLVAGGAVFTVASENAEAVEVVLFDETGTHETGRHALARVTDDLFSGFVPDVAAGSRYGLGADGPFDPARGHRFDASKLLVDPYALALDRPFAYDPRLGRFGADTADLVPKGVVTALPEPPPRRAPTFRPGGLIYELPVKPFTRLHPDIPEPLRGTLAALAEPAALDHLVKVGVNAVELMPIVAWIDERHLPPLGLSNGWGYNPVTFFPLDPRIAPGGIADLRLAVDALHAAGIDLFLDVVFNHTGESDMDGTTLSLRGLDNAVYYRHAAEDPGRLVNDTGTGNTLACDRPVVRRMILDAMRHLVIHGGVDGFRFDLAPIIGRDGSGFSPDAAIFAEIAADPVLSARIMIAEPWDIGPGGYQLGNFPPPFLEWNDRYRDDVRRFWRGDRGMIGAVATRLAGSSDIFERSGAAISRTVDFIAAHDGFALADVVAYEHKHNEANGEENRDGHDENLSWNNGAEGRTDDPAVVAARQRDAAALIATLFASRGTIMLTAGDEFGRTQQGNNNVYAQDNPLTWLDWRSRDRGFEDHAVLWSALRRHFPALADPRFLTGLPKTAGEAPDVIWWHPVGREMTVDDWQAPDAAAFAMILDPGNADNDDAARIAVLINRAAEDVSFALPRQPERTWRRVDRQQPAPAGVVGLGARSVGLAVERCGDPPK